MKPESLQFRYKNLGAVIISSLMVCALAFYNGYALFFNNDSAVYIMRAFSSENLPDRPILYGIFIFLVGRMQSLWLIVFFQAFTVSFFLYLYFKYLRPLEERLLSYLIYVAFAAFLTSLSFEASWIMPDFFTSICALCIGLLIFVPKMTIRDSCIVHVFLIVAVGMHNSHLYIFLGCLIIILVSLLFQTVRRDYRLLQINFFKLARITLIVICGNVGLAGVQYIYTGSFKGTRGGDAFLFSNLVEMGIINQFLNESCPVEKFSICKYKDALPSNFLWDPRSPINRDGGWEKNIQEYSVIIRKVMTSKYVVGVGYKSLLNGIKQIFNHDMADNVQASTSTIQAIEFMFPDDVERHRNSKQYYGKLGIGFINYSQILIFGICLSVAIWSFLYSPFPDQQRYLLLFFLLVLVVNAAVCGIFSGVFPRYQTRVVWLMTLPLFIFVDYKQYKIKKILESFTLTK